MLKVIEKQAYLYTASTPGLCDVHYCTFAFSTAGITEILWLFLLCLSKTIPLGALIAQKCYFLFFEFSLLTEQKYAA